MAIYHLSVKPVQRSKGRSATASMAYRAGEKIHDQRTGLTHDYTKKKGIEHNEIITPKGVNIPSREQLWNMAEQAERRKDGCTAREYEVNLPYELSKEQRIALCKDFANELASRHGVAVDICMHEPNRHGDDRNYHAHIMTTTRKIDNNGLGEKADIEKAGRKRKDDLQEARKLWADLANKHLEKAHIAERIDYRSHKDRGLDTLPTVKMGWEATQIDRTADRMLEQGKVSQRSFLGEINREIESLNRDIKGVQAELQDLQLEIQVQNRKPPQEIQKQIELTAVSEPVAQPKPQTPLETHRKPIDPQENKQATTVPQLQKKANQEQNRPINEPSKNDINQKQGLILEYAEKAQTIAKAILDSQLKALREEAKPILEKYHTLKDSKPLMFGKEQWQKDTDNALKQYNAIKNAHDTMKDKGATDGHYKQAREHIAKREPSYHAQVQQAIKDLENHRQQEQDKYAREHGADVYAKKGVIYRGEIVRADDKGILQQTKDGIVYHPPMQGIEQGKSYNLENKGDHYQTQQSYEIRTSTKSQDRGMER